MSPRNNPKKASKMTKINPKLCIMKFQYAVECRRGICTISMQFSVGGEFAPSNLNFNFNYLLWILASNFNYIFSALNSITYFHLILFQLFISNSIYNFKFQLHTSTLNFNNIFKFQLPNFNFKFLQHQIFSTSNFFNFKFL